MPAYIQYMPYLQDRRSLYKQLSTEESSDLVALEIKPDVSDDEWGMVPQE